MDLLRSLSTGIGNDETKYYISHPYIYSQRITGKTDTPFARLGANDNNLILDIYYGTEHAVLQYNGKEISCLTGAMPQDTKIYVAENILYFYAINDAPLTITIIGGYEITEPLNKNSKPSKNAEKIIYIFTNEVYSASLWSGTIAPDSSIGSIGDFYIQMGESQKALQNGSDA